MAILTVQESAMLLKTTANNVMADGSVSMYPLHARAILDVLAAFETVCAVCDALQAQIDATAEDFAAQKRHAKARNSEWLGWHCNQSYKAV